MSEASNGPNLEALRQVVRVLRELPREKKVDMEDWYQCETVACACGWAAQDEWFKKRGFRLKWYRWGPGEGFGPVYCDLEGFSAVQEFFNLGHDDAFYLFNYFYYKRGNRRDVTQRLEAFIREHEAGRAA